MIVSATRRASFAVPDTGTGIGASALARGRVRTTRSPFARRLRTGRCTPISRRWRRDCSRNPCRSGSLAWSWLLAAHRDAFSGRVPRSERPPQDECIDEAASARAARPPRSPWTISRRPLRGPCRARMCLQCDRPSPRGKRARRPSEASVYSDPGKMTALDEGRTSRPAVRGSTIGNSGSCGRATRCSRDQPSRFAGRRRPVLSRSWGPHGASARLHRGL